MIVIHLIETRSMVGRLRKHSVPMLGKVWWGWVGATMSEGFTSFMRLSDVIDEQEQRQGRREKAKR